MQMKNSNPTVLTVHVDDLVSIGLDSGDIDEKLWSHIYAVDSPRISYMYYNV